MSGAKIDSESKRQVPPTAVACMLVDHANARTLAAILDSTIAAEDDAMLEKVVHTAALHCRMHNQVLMDVLLPLVGQLSSGEELSAQMKEKVLELEKLLEEIDATKKHLKNEEFVKLMQQKKKAEQELMAMAENDVLPAMMEELDESAMIKAAEQMEEVKVKAPLMPQAKALAA